MGIRLKDLIGEEEQESLVEDKSKKTMRLILLGIAVLVVVIILVVGILIKNSILQKQQIKINNLAKDIANLTESVLLIGEKYRNDPENVELIGTSLEENAQTLSVNGKNVRYQYNYYYLSPTEVNSINANLNEKNEAYIVNYNTGEVVNGVEWNGRRYHSNEDIAVLASGDKTVKPPSDSIVYINTAEEMELIRQNPDGYYKLCADIDMKIYQNGNGWNPIDNFSGRFEGRGYKISGLKINRNSEEDCGLFGSVTAKAVLSEIILTEVDVAGGEKTGALAGSCSGTIKNCNVTGNVSGSGNFVGGMFGIYDTNTITNSHANVYVTGINNVGGMIGTIYNGKLERVSANGTVIGDGNVGGLIGEIAPTSEIEIGQTFAKVNITGKGDTGGLIGKINATRTSGIKIINSYSNCVIDDIPEVAGGFIGNIDLGSAKLILEQVYAATTIPTQSATKGGFAGRIKCKNDGIEIVHCLWEKHDYYDDGLKDVGDKINTQKTFESRNDKEMKLQNTYEWNFSSENNPWKMEDGARPKFKWEETATKKSK